MKFLCIIPIFALVQVLNSLSTQFKTGTGALVIQEFQENAPIIKVFKNKLKELKLKPEQIYSNENKIISIYTQFQKISELPQSMQFRGNEYYLDDITFNAEKVMLMNIIEKGDFLIFYKELDTNHPRYDDKLTNWIHHILKDERLSFFRENNCYCIWKK